MSIDLFQINLYNYDLVVAGKTLLKNTELSLAKGQRYGIIGKNGVGKTSLLRDVVQNHATHDILYLEQEIEGSDQTVFNTVMKANEKKIKLEERLKYLESVMGQSDLEFDPVEEYEEISQELIGIGAEKDKSIVHRILHGLGFSPEDQERPTKEFSGGWRMRVSLAKALYMEPLFLFLDEPTNHLDLEAVIWLTDYLRQWKNCLCVISHNRHFLNEIVSKIIDFTDKNIKIYPTNYDSYLKVKDQNLKHQTKEYEKLFKQIKALKAKSKPKAQIQALQKKADLLKPARDYVVKISFHEVPKITQQIIEVHDVSFKYPGTDQVVLKDLDFGLDMNSRITIVGANGSGKSTLINLLVGNLQPTTGVINKHHKLVVGYYNQHFVDVLPLDISPVEYIEQIAKDNWVEEYQDFQAIRKLLGMIGLEGPKHLIKIGDLSGGQKARVAFTSLYVQKPRLLLLDEPTNHLDIQTIDALINGINNYDGGVVIISHDPNLIMETESQLWLCQDRTVKKFEGDYDDYADYVLEL